MANQAELKITLTQAGQIQIEGPIDNKMLCYGMMECARDAIKEFTDQKAKSPIVPANGVLPDHPALRRM